MADEIILYYLLSTWNNSWGFIVSLKACSDNEAEDGSAVEMRCHNTICAKRVSPIQLALIINASLSNRYLFIKLRVHAATHVHAHTPYTPLLESQRRQRVADSITFLSITCFKWSSNISVAGCFGMFQQALAFICLRVAHFWWFSLTRRWIAHEMCEGQKRRDAAEEK